MANYTNQRALYGGVVGSMIIHTTPGLGFSNDPNSAVFREKLPAGYLKCDGSVLNAKDYPALANVLGTGSESRFIKDNVSIREPDETTGDLGQFILPDLGSKVIVGGRGTGIYNNYRIDRGIEETNPTTRVGPQVEIISNFGNRIETFYVGNMQIEPRSGIPMIGNPRFNLPRATDEVTLNIDNFQGHLHEANQVYTNYNAQHATSTIGGKDGGNLSASSGHGMESGTSSVWDATSVHKHNIGRPSTYSHNFEYSYGTVQVDMSGVSAYVDVDLSDDEKLDDLNTPFILVEYLIKY